MKFIGLSWSGNEYLWKVFWLYYIAPQILLWIFVGTTQPSPMMGRAGLISILIAVIFYIIWVHISLWRCAFNTKWRILGWCVRLCMFYVILAFVFGFFTGVLFFTGV